MAENPILIMERLTGWFRRPVITLLLAIAVSSLFGFIGLRKAYPFVHNITPENSYGNDWLKFHNMAIDILDHGLSIPIYKSSYKSPGGFLYNYFVAAIYAIDGRNAAWVYVIQSFMLGLSVFLMYLLARRYLSGTMSLLFLVAAGFLAWHDVFDYTVRLLSEGLAVLLVPIALLSFLHACRKESPAWFAFAGALSGVLILTRQNLTLVPAGLAIVVLLYLKDKRRAALCAVAFASFAALVFSLIMLRNYSVTGHLELANYQHMILRERADVAPGWHGLLTLTVLGKRAIYCLGVLLGGYAMEDRGVIVVVQHWLLLCAAAFGMLAVAIRRRTLDLIDATCLIFVVLTFVPFIFMPRLGGYGMRFQTPYAGPLLLLACRFFDVLLAPLFRPGAPYYSAPVSKQSGNRHEAVAEH